MKAQVNHMETTPIFKPLLPKHKHLALSPRQRVLLHRLLYGELAKCSTVALNSLERRGWIFGRSGSYQFTEKGRRVAELSELAPPDGELELDLA